MGNLDGTKEETMNLIIITRCNGCQSELSMRLPAMTEHQAALLASRILCPRCAKSRQHAPPVSCTMKVGAWTEHAGEPDSTQGGASGQDRAREGLTIIFLADTSLRRGPTAASNASLKL
jgi:hypothetical protein